MRRPLHAAVDSGTCFGGYIEPGGSLIFAVVASAVDALRMNVIYGNLMDGQNDGCSDLFKQHVIGWVIPTHLNLTSYHSQALLLEINHLIRHVIIQKKKLRSPCR